jgi:transaldolase
VAAHRSEPLDVIVDQVLVRFGLEILKVVPGRVSTEVDARLSFDTAATLARARRLISAVRGPRHGPPPGADQDRGHLGRHPGRPRAGARRHPLQPDLLFAFCQAVACGDAGVRLISPFVGRIYDWYKKSAGAAWDEAAHAAVNDPGVQSVSRIYTYYKPTASHRGDGRELSQRRARSWPWPAATC